MMRVRNTLPLSILLLTAALARGQERGPSHLQMPDWARGGDMRRAADMARQLQEAGIGPPPAQNLPPETIKNLLDMLEKMDKQGLERAIRNNPEFAEKLKDSQFAEQL